ncbi:BrnA antitoxin family protein [Microbacteriaceae bacterium K1510]|nr:BrnA antitoxin family protein [Microbacteriaceae bacterium K1510]
MNNDRSRRGHDPRKAAEAAFKAATTKPIESPKQASVLPGVRETVSLRIDKDVLEYFQEGGPGWQDRINETLRKAIGK